jgi:tetrahydromethanopterin S-methyltransferase subunit G
MTENVENLLLEHMKRFQASLDRIERRLDELTTRQTETHAAVLGVRRDQVNDAEIAAHLQVQFDSLRARLDRIESRLELSS